MTGHYVNYRKQISPSMQVLLPEEQFGLYAVSVRFPQNLAQQVDFQLIQPGVYDCRWGTDVIRIVVLRQLPQSDNNAPLHLLSASAEQFRFGTEHYRMHSDDTSTLLWRLFEKYLLEGVNMSYTMADFRRDFVKEHLQDLTLEERFKGVSPEEVLKVISPEEVLKHPEDVLKGLSPKDKATLLKLLASPGQPHPPT